MLLATLNLPKFLTFLRNFCEGVKIYHFSSKIILGKFYRHLAIFFWSHCNHPSIHRLCKQIFQPQSNRFPNSIEERPRRRHFPERNFETLSFKFWIWLNGMRKLNIWTFGSRMTRIAILFSIFSMKICQSWFNFFQILNKPSQNCQKLYNFRQIKSHWL